MSIKTELNDFRFRVKELICQYVIDIYKSNNEGKLPNWEEDEEFVVNGNYINNYSIAVVVGNTYDDELITHNQIVVEIRVTLDYNLFFVTNEFDNEIEWSEINTDDLVSICNLFEINSKK